MPGLFFCTTKDYFSSLGLFFGFVTGILFEKKWVRFENTPSLLRRILRALAGGVLFLALDALLKLPFPKDFLNGGSYAAMMVRAARYAVIVFLEFGVYPLVFRYTDQWFAKQSPAA